MSKTPLSINLMNLNSTIEVISMLISMLLLKYTLNKAFAWITFILIVTVLNELIFVPYIISYQLFERNIAYNIYSIIDMTSWFIFFYLIYKNKLIRTVLLILSAICFSFSFYELLVIKGWIYIHSDSLRVYDISIIFLSACYLFTILKKEYHSLWSDNIFWICAACILYHAIIFINFTTLSEINEYWNNPQALQNFAILQGIANTAYYLLICIAFFVGFYQYKLHHQK